MRLSPRRRFAIAMLVSWPVGLLYLYWLWINGLNLLRYYHAGSTGIDCSSRYFAAFNGCDPSTYSVWLAWFELLVATAVMVGFGLMLGRWVLRPLRQMADIVAQLGPTSLGVRMRPSGPRDESRLLAEAIDAMLDRVAEGYEAQRRFAATASHELRTPLATQRALIEVSLGSALTAEQLELVSRQLLATNERNEALIEGLLVLAETERGLMANTAQRIDLITGSVVDALRASAAERGIRLDAELAPVEVRGEAPLLERLVGNLVQNAVKYNAPGGWVCVRVEPPGWLTVANSGPEVPADQVAGLFEPFRRARGERLDHGDGVGLGLTIARSIVAAHAGAITATANPGGGLTVSVGLPGAHSSPVRSHR
jgi:signal transduction histidine kinase